MGEPKNLETRAQLIELARIKIEKMNHGCVYTTDYELKKIFEEVVDQYELTLNDLQKYKKLYEFQTLYLKKSAKEIEFMKLKLKEHSKNKL